MSKRSTIAVLGAGFAGMAAAATLAARGYDVHLIEKHDQPGGRSRHYAQDGFMFDMGPSWYWMPEVFESFYNSFGRTTSDFYDLRRLDPAYQVIFNTNETVAIPADRQAQMELFESIEQGSGKVLDQFLGECQYKYETAMTHFVRKPSHSWTEFLDWRILSAALRMRIFRSMASDVRRRFKHPRLRQILEFPVLFLGAKPERIPALYGMMNHADFTLGTWYPMGGMCEIVKAMSTIATDVGVHWHLQHQAEGVVLEGDRIAGIKTDKGIIPAEGVINAMDYHFMDQQLLPKTHREYKKSYWQNRELAPSCLLFYLGISAKVPGLLHHNLFFDADFARHAGAIYDHPKWPEQPLFYACVPSKTDPGVAPEGMENIFLLMPVAPGLEDNPDIRRHYLDLLLQRLEKHTGISIREKIVHQHSYGYRNFVSDYNAFKGNAYGLANTLLQTGFLKPRLRSTRINNLWHAGQLSVPGPGVPPSLISGQIAAEDLMRAHPL